MIRRTHQEKPLLAAPGRFGLVALLATVALLLILLPGTARAMDNVERMLELSDEATDAIMAGRYEEAAAKFREAYGAYPDPVLLKNEMIAWFRADICRMALPAADAFLRSGELTDEDRSDVNRVQIDCHLRLAERAIADGHPETAERLIGDAYLLELDDDDHARLVALQVRIEEGRPADEALVAPPAPARMSTRTIAGWSLTGAGAAMFTGAVVYHAVALSRQSELEALSTGDDPLRFESKRDEYLVGQQRARWLVPTLYAAGGALAAGGIYFLVQEADSDSPAIHGRIGPVYHPGGFGARLRIHF